LIPAPASSLPLPQGFTHSIFSYFADGTGGSREILIFKEGALYEKLAVEIGPMMTIPVRSVTMRLVSGERVAIKIFTGAALQTGTGTFSGYRVD